MLRRSLEQLNPDNDYTTKDLHPCCPYSQCPSPPEPLEGIPTRVQAASRLAPVIGGPDA